MTAAYGQDHFKRRSFKYPGPKPYRGFTGQVQHLAVNTESYQEPVQPPQNMSDMLEPTIVLVTFFREEGAT